MSDSDEEVSLNFAVTIAEGDDMVADVTRDLQEAFDRGLDLPVNMIPPLIKMMRAQQDLVHVLYEFWALVGDKIQEAEGEDNG